MMPRQAGSESSRLADADLNESLTSSFFLVGTSRCSSLERWERRRPRIDPL